MQGLSSDDFMLPRSLPTSPTSPTAAAGTSYNTISSIPLVTIIIGELMYTKLVKLVVEAVFKLLD